MIEQLLEKAKRRVDTAEVYALDDTTMELSFEAGKLKSAEHKVFSGLGLRVIHNGRLGFSSTTDPGTLDEMVEKARAASAFGKAADFEFPARSDLSRSRRAGAEPQQADAAENPAVITFDPAVESYSPEEAVREGRKAVEMLRETVPKGLTDVHIETSVSTIRILNTSGLDVSYRTTDFSHYIQSVIVDGDSILWIDDGGNYSNLTVGTEKYVRKISGLATLAEKKAPKVSGSLPVIVTAEELPELLESIEMGVDGKRLLKGESPLIGREGKKVLGQVTLVDDPFVDNGIGSRPFDDEGVPSQRTVLFDNGVFRSFLFDLDTAAKTGSVSTANAERQSLSTPMIGTSNLVMSTGTSNLDEMIADTREGVIVYGVLGGGQSNLIAGDFALNIMLGFHIRDGEVRGRLTDTMVSGNVYDAFGVIARMGAEIRHVGSVFVPDVMFSELSVSSR